MTTAIDDNRPDEDCPAAVAAIDLDAIRRHVELFTSGIGPGSGAVVSLVRMRPGTNDISWRAFIEAADTEQIARVAAVQGLTGEAYLVPNLYRADAVTAIREREGRGREDELYAVNGFTADIDAGKENTNYPPQSVVKAALAKLSLRPTWVNISGRADGGVHAGFLFRRPYVIAGDDDLTRLKAVARRLWQAIKIELGNYKLDRTPLLSLAQPFRIAGTINHKHGAPVRSVVYRPDRRFSIDDFEEWLPPEPEPVRPRVTAVHRRFGFHDLNHVHERARRYLDAIPGAVSGQDGHRNTFKTASALVWGFDLSPDIAYPLFAEWNVSCSPPWSEHELWHKLKWADEHEPRGRERGYLLHADRPGTNGNGKPINGNGKASAGLFQWVAGKMVLTPPVDFRFGKIDRPAEKEEPETPQPEPIPERPLEEIRQELRQRRLDSLKREPAQYLDHTPPGSGKTTAGAEPAVEAGSSLFVTKTHKAARAVSRELEEHTNGRLKIFCYPELTAETCEAFAEASFALDCGLPVATAVCPSCLHRKYCTYHDELSEAEYSRHAAATHKRVSMTAGKVAKGRRFISVDEDAVDMFSPIAEVSGGMAEVVAIAGLAKQAAALEQDMSLQHFFFRMENTAQYLGERLFYAPETAALDMGHPAGHPPKVDSTLLRVIKKTGIRPGKDPLRICRAMAAGDLESINIRVDEVLGAKREKVIRRSIQAVWRVRFPDSCTVWLNDSTASLAEIEAVSGRATIDGTPSGRVRQQHSVIQIPIDIQKGTGPKVVVDNLRGVLAALPGYTRIGLLIDRAHISAVKGTARSGAVLDEINRHRISKIEYFRGTESRGSNAWLADCDLVLVYGTPRVNATIVKTRLLQRGNVEAAKQVPEWVAIEWTGTDSAGRQWTITTKDYDDPEWSDANKSLVHSELVQSAGRGRGICDHGIPVVIVTRENLGYTLADFTVYPIDETSFRALLVLSGLSDAFSKGVRSDIFPYIVKGVRHYMSGEIATALDRSNRQAIRLLNDLCETGFVEKIASRSGWKISPKGLAAVGATLLPDDLREPGEHEKEREEKTYATTN